MTERIFVGVAWPYANGSLHLGQIAGAYLPSDIFARYHRLKGNEVLMVSGSDQHGTPITVRAEREGRTPQEVVTQFHQEFLETWDRLGISFDLFTTTGTENHLKTTHDIFLRLYERGYIYTGKMMLPYCAVEQRFLLDRYVEGKCPLCGFDNARGDQCDNCGNVLDPVDLLDPRCKFDGSTPEQKESEHFFLKLSAFNEPLRQWLSQGKEHWRKHVLNFSLGLLNEGLRDRAITRDLTWGIPIPLPGYESKRIYVWFEAVIGYLSASIEWAQRVGKPEKWQDFWLDPTCQSYYFIGKDNIPFHTLIWPMMLMGYGNLNLPYDVPANQYLTMSGSKASTSRNWAVWVPDYLSRYDPDPIRYYLAANNPETSDSDFTWEEFVRRNNDELVATYGNLIHRVLTFTYRNFDGKVPQRGELDSTSIELLEKTKSTFERIDSLLHACSLREAIRTIMSLAQETNRYLDEKSPWKTFKEQPQLAGTSLSVALSVIAGLRTLLYPFLPFSSERLHRMLGFTGSIVEEGWGFRLLPAGQQLREPEALFIKLDEKVIEEETNRLG